MVISDVRVTGRHARASVGYDYRGVTDSAWFALVKTGAHWRITNAEPIPPPDECGCGG